MFCYSDDMWNSLSFILLLRTLLPVIATGTLLTAIYAIYEHNKNLHISKLKLSNNETIVWILIGLILEVIASCIRIVYFTGGPLQCNGTFRIQDHSYLLLISNPFEVITERRTAPSSRSPSSYYSPGFNRSTKHQSISNLRLFYSRLLLPV